MSDTTEHSGWGRTVRRLAGLALLASVGVLTACEGLLEVELPGQITAESVYQPSEAPVLVNSAIADIECAYSDFIASNGAGNADAFARITGWWNGSHEFEATPSTSSCSSSETSYGWFTPLHKGRYQAEEVYDRLTEWTVEEVPERESLMAQASIYAGVAYTLLGEHFCEVSADTGPLMSPNDALGVAEDHFTTALQHIQASGDFSIPVEITESAEQLAYLLRARARFASGDLTGAAEDAAQVEEGFEARVTRESGGERKRWNRVYSSHNQASWNSLIGPIDWWEGPPDPVTGQPWPDVIPFTGYRDLAILDDGRAISEDQYPIARADFPDAQLDTRVPVVDMDASVNNYQVWNQQKYTSLDDDFPLAKWEEAWLILAEIEGGSDAIDRVNDIREAHDLPIISGDYESELLGDPDALQDMIIEERRRSHFLEGRFWSTKLRKDLWFPRGVGGTNYPYNYNQGVRMVMPTLEYELNSNFGLSDRGTLCDPDEAPVL